MSSTSSLCSGSGSPLPAAPPPTYRESSPPPFYTLTASSSEEILETTRVYNTPTGSLTAKCHCGTLKLIMHEQREDVDIPVYHRQGLIRGTISHSRPEETCGIVQVYLKIEGKLKMNAIGEKPVSTSFKFLDETLELWSKRRPDSATASCAPETICPQHMDFAYVLPKTFRDPESGSVTGGNEYPLPPSHEICMMGIPGLQSQCVYRVNVVIVTRGSSWIPLKSTTTFPIPFKYLPRSRPAEPPLSHNGHDIGVDYPLFHATIKRTPELWLETNAVLQPRATTGLAPVDVQLFIPSGRTFGLADKIPFHLQLTGPAASLKALYSLLPVDQVANAGSSNKSGSLIACSSSIPATSGPNPKSTPASASATGSGSISITISLSRQVYVKIKDDAVWKSVVIGQGRVHPLPPPFDSEYINLTSTQSGTTGTVEEREYDPERIENLDGAGEVECRPDIHFGHFDSGRLRVKDYLILQIGSPSPKSTSFQDSDPKLPFSPLRMSVPVLMVSDSYSESG